MKENRYVEFQIIMQGGYYLVKCKSCGKLQSMKSTDYHNGINPCNCGKDK